MQNRIIKLRETLHMSQREFGENIGVSRDMVGSWEIARVKPKDVAIRHMCKIYGVNESWLRTGQGHMFDSVPKVSKESQEAQALFLKLHPDLQYVALEQMKVLLKLQKAHK